jgi:hypothetical protein
MRTQIGSQDSCYSNRVSDKRLYEAEEMQGVSAVRSCRDNSEMRGIGKLVDGVPCHPDADLHTLRDLIGRIRH